MLSIPSISTSEKSMAPSSSSAYRRGRPTPAWSSRIATADNISAAAVTPIVDGNRRKRALSQASRAVMTRNRGMTWDLLSFLCGAV